jgi:hypothetical protein
MPGETTKGGEPKPLSTSIHLVDSIARDQTKKNVLVVHKRTLTFRDGMLVGLSTSTPREEIPIGPVAPE